MYYFSFLVRAFNFLFYLEVMYTFVLLCLFLEVLLSILLRLEFLIHFYSYFFCMWYKTRVKIPSPPHVDTNCSSIIYGKLGVFLTELHFNHNSDEHKCMGLLLFSLLYSVYIMPVCMVLIILAL